MAATLILGGDKLALTMAKILTSVGERVCLVGGGGGGRAQLEKMLREEVEKDVPFQFVDDLRHQQKALKDRLDRVRFCQRSSEADSNIRVVLATQADSLDLFQGSAPVATFTADAEWPNHVAVRLYQPFEQTKMAQVLVHKDTDPAAVFSIRNLLQTMGIDEITREEADRADRMLGKSSLDDIIKAILPSRKRVDFASAVMH